MAAAAPAVEYTFETATEEIGRLGKLSPHDSNKAIQGTLLLVQQRVASGVKIAQKDRKQLMNALIKQVERTSRHDSTEVTLTLIEIILLLQTPENLDKTAYHINKDFKQIFSVLKIMLDIGLNKIKKFFPPEPGPGPGFAPGPGPAADPNAARKRVSEVFYKALDLLDRWCKELQAFKAEQDALENKKAKNKSFSYDSIQREVRELLVSMLKFNSSDKYFPTSKKYHHELKAVWKIFFQYINLQDMSQIELAILYADFVELFIFKSDSSKDPVKKEITELLNTLQGLVDNAIAYPPDPDNNKPNLASLLLDCALHCIQFIPSESSRLLRKAYQMWDPSIKIDTLWNKAFLICKILEAGSRLHKGQANMSSDNVHNYIQEILHCFELIHKDRDPAELQKFIQNLQYQRKNVPAFLESLETCLDHNEPQIAHLLLPALSAFLSENLLNRGIAALLQAVALIKLYESNSPAIRDADKAQFPKHIEEHVQTALHCYEQHYQQLDKEEQDRIPHLLRGNGAAKKHFIEKTALLKFMQCRIFLENQKNIQLSLHCNQLIANNLTGSSPKDFVNKMETHIAAFRLNLSLPGFDPQAINSDAIIAELLKPINHMISLAPPPVLPRPLLSHAGNVLCGVPWHLAAMQKYGLSNDFCKKIQNTKFYSFTKVKMKIFLHRFTALRMLISEAQQKQNSEAEHKHALELEQEFYDNFWNLIPFAFSTPTEFYNPANSHIYGTLILELRNLAQQHFFRNNIRLQIFALETALVLHGVTPHITKSLLHCLNDFIICCLSLPDNFAYPGRTKALSYLNYAFRMFLCADPRQIEVDKPTILQFIANIANLLTQRGLHEEAQQALEVGKQLSRIQEQSGMVAGPVGAESGAGAGVIPPPLPFTLVPEQCKDLLFSAPLLPPNYSIWFPIKTPNATPLKPVSCFSLCAENIDMISPAPRPSEEFRAQFKPMFHSLRGSKVNFLNSTQENLIIQLFANGNLDYAKEFLTEQNIPQVKSNDGFDLLTVAVLSGNLTAVMFAYPKMKGLHQHLQFNGLSRISLICIAVVLGHIEIVKFFLSLGHSLDSSFDIALINTGTRVGFAANDLTVDPEMLQLIKASAELSELTEHHNEELVNRFNVLSNLVPIAQKWKISDKTSVETFDLLTLSLFRNNPALARLLFQKGFLQQCPWILQDPNYFYCIMSFPTRELKQAWLLSLNNEFQIPKHHFGFLLVAAASAQDVTLFQWLHKELGLSLEMGVSNGVTALQTAIKFNAVDIIQYILREVVQFRGQNLALCNRAYDPILIGTAVEKHPLLLAIKNNNLSLVILLLEPFRLDPRLFDHLNLDPIIEAFDVPNLDNNILRALIEAGVNIEKPYGFPLNEDVDVRALITTMATFIRLREHLTPSRWTLQIINHDLTNGFSLTARGNNGVLPLQLAAANPDVFATFLRLDHFAREIASGGRGCQQVLSLKDFQNKTVLDIADENNFFEVSYLCSLHQERVEHAGRVIDWRSYERETEQQVMQGEMKEETDAISFLIEQSKQKFEKMSSDANSESEKSAIRLLMERDKCLYQQELEYRFQAIRNKYQARVQELIQQDQILTKKAIDMLFEKLERVQDLRRRANLYFNLGQLLEQFLDHNCARKCLVKFKSLRDHLNSPLTAHELNTYFYLMGYIDYHNPSEERDADHSHNNDFTVGPGLGLEGMASQSVAYQAARSLDDDDAPMPPVNDPLTEHRKLRSFVALTSLRRSTLAEASDLRKVILRNLFQNMFGMEAMPDLNEPDGFMKFLELFFKVEAQFSENNGSTSNKKVAALRSVVVQKQKMQEAFGRSFYSGNLWFTTPGASGDIHSAGPGPSDTAEAKDAAESVVVETKAAAEENSVERLHYERTLHEAGVPKGIHGIDNIMEMLLELYHHYKQVLEPAMAAVQARQSRIPSPELKRQADNKAAVDQIFALPSLAHSVSTLDPEKRKIEITNIVTQELKSRGTKRKAPEPEQGPGQALAFNTATHMPNTAMNAAAAGAGAGAGNQNGSQYTIVRVSAAGAGSGATVGPVIYLPSGNFGNGPSGNTGNAAAATPPENDSERPAKRQKL